MMRFDRDACAVGDAAGAEVELTMHDGTVRYNKEKTLVGEG